MKITLFTLCLAISSICDAQTVNMFDKINCKSISSINWLNFDHKQLDFFDSLFLKKDILILSESDHGDGSTMEAECMIMKGLIDSGKIDAIYTESPWMIIDKINNIIHRSGVKDSNEIKLQMSSIELKYWVDNGFWNYLANKISEGKIKLFGFDVGASTQIVNEMLVSALKVEEINRHVKEFKKSNKLDYEDVIWGFKYYDGYGLASNFSEDLYNAYKGFITPIIKYYKNVGQQGNVDKWQGILDCFYWMYKRTLLLVNNKYANVPEGDIQNSSFFSLRDSFMAAHFLKEYAIQKDKKSLLLMSNYHAVRNSNIIEGLTNCCKSSDVYLMDEILDKALPGKIYNMCFINAYGTHQVNYFYKAKPGIYPTPFINSLEYMIATNYKGDYCVSDLETSSIKDSVFYMRPVFYKYLRSNWAKNFSGFFFIRKMEPLYFKHFNLVPVAKPQ